MTHPVVEHFGLEWLESGVITARFTHPVYDGEEIYVEAIAKDNTSLVLGVTNSSATVCAAGSAAVGAEKASIDLGEYRPSPLPQTLPEASEEAFATAGLLGSVEGVFSAPDAKAFLDLIDEGLPLYLEKGVAHPGWLLTWANLALTSNFRLGPWIHVSSDVHWLGTVVDGDHLATRGRVVKTFERKGHRFVELDVVLVANETLPVMQVTHVAIYEPLSSAASP